MTVKALLDPGSESSFFFSDLLPFAVNKTDQSFKIETLSPNATKPEVVHGLEAPFQVQIPEGETVTLRLLQHSGLELRALKLKSKILTCSEGLANKYNLERAEPCTNGQRCLRKPLAKLSLILVMDLHHVQPKLVEQFSDKHGFMGLYACYLLGSLITCGNRVFGARMDLSQNMNSFGVATEYVSDLEKDNLSFLPSTALFHSAFQVNCQTAKLQLQLQRRGKRLFQFGSVQRLLQFSSVQRQQRRLHGQDPCPRLLPPL